MVWELFNLRAQNAQQQTEAIGLRTRANANEVAASSAQQLVGILRADLETRQRISDGLQRQLDEVLDDVDAKRAELKQLRQQYAELAAANTMLLRERHVLRELLKRHADYLETRMRLLDRLVETLGANGLSSALGFDYTTHSAGMDAAIAKESAWCAERDPILARIVAQRVAALDALPSDPPTSPVDLSKR